ncbi:MAG TPA: TraM recognition domain-containing protein [Candidatus Saccharimonadales bacterium]
MKLKQAEPYICLELIPPSYEYKTPLATEQLFSVLHGFGDQTVLSIEVVSTRAEGIRFIAKVSKEQTSSFIRAVASYLPEVNVREIPDYINDLNNAKVVTFEQTKHWAYPLKGHSSLEENDPMSYITGSMTKLNDDEILVYQLVLSPVQPKEVTSISKKILTNENLEVHLHKTKSKTASVAVKVINKLFFAITDTVTEVHHGSSKEGHMSYQKDASDKHKVQMGLKPARQVTNFELDLNESVRDKLAQPLFQADIRVLVLSNNEDEMLRRVNDFKAALKSLSMTGHQSLKANKTADFRISDNLAHNMSSKRLKNSNLLSVSEIASIYHFPSGNSHKTENVLKSLSRSLPAPVNLKNDTKLDILLGKNEYHGLSTPIGLTAEERERHVYIIGGTGNGKTTMLLYSIVQDINNGKGLAVLDPHGDLAETILRHIPEERIKDVIYLNPDDLSHPIGVNLLELDPSLTGDDLLREKDLITESTISVLRKIFSDDDSGGHRIEYVLRNAIQTALKLDGANLFTIFRLLNDAKFRRVVIKNLKDEDLKNFWNNELGKAGEMQRVKMSAGITAKIGRFLFSASAKRMLEQEKSTIDFDNILDSGKILICNFSKGLLGEDTSTLFGTTILAKLQVASLRRARLNQTDRHPFYLYVDEFQNFATMSFVQMLSEARKYKLFLTMAEQSTSQQDQQRLVDIILANVGTVICFRSGSPADERYVLPLFYPYIEQGEIANLSAYNFYARIAAVNAQEPMSGVTVLIDDNGSEELARKASHYSRTTYESKVVVVQKEQAPTKQHTKKIPTLKSDQNKNDIRSKVPA